MQKFILLFLILLLGVASCDVLAQPAPTPLVITATSEQVFLIVTNTPSPSPSPVLAPTLALNTGQSDGQSAPAATQTPIPTEAITMTPTFTITPTDTPATPGAAIGPVGGVVAVAEIGNCTAFPSGGFATVYDSNPELAAQLGCPVEPTAASVSNAYQPYQSGAMVWVASVGSTGQSGIFAIYNNGTYQRFNDTWVDGVDPIGVGAQPPQGLIEPIRGFGKVWRESGGVSQALGWATGGETGGAAFIQNFERGAMVYVPQNGQTYIFISGQPGTWTSFAQAY